MPKLPQPQTKMLHKTTYSRIQYPDQQIEGFAQPIGQKMTRIDKYTRPSSDLLYQRLLQKRKRRRETTAKCTQDQLIDPEIRSKIYKLKPIFQIKKVSPLHLQPMSSIEITQRQTETAQSAPQARTFEANPNPVSDNKLKELSSIKIIYQNEPLEPQRITQEVLNLKENKIPNLYNDANSEVYFQLAYPQIVSTPQLQQCPMPYYPTNSDFNQIVIPPVFAPSSNQQFQFATSYGNTIEPQFSIRYIVPQENLTPPLFMFGDPYQNQQQYHQMMQFGDQNFSGGYTIQQVQYVKPQYFPLRERNLPQQFLQSISPYVSKDLQDYYEIKLLGCGEISKVFIYGHQKTRVKVAAKFIQIKYDKSQNQKDLILAKALLQLSCDRRHQNLLMNLSVKLSSKECLVLMPYFSKYISLKESNEMLMFSEYQIRAIINQIHFALQELNSYELSHGNLKLSNIFFNKNSLKVKVSDYGNQRKIFESFFDCIQNSECPSVLVIQSLFKCATPTIEMSLEEKQMFDYFSLGCCVWELITKKTVWQTLSTVLEKQNPKEKESVLFEAQDWERFSTSMKEFIYACLLLVPGKNLTVKQLSIYKVIDFTRSENENFDCDSMVSYDQ